MVSTVDSVVENDVVRTERRTMAFYWGGRRYGSMDVRVGGPSPVALKPTQQK